jgi:chromosome segregation ATPase
MYIKKLALLSVGMLMVAVFVPLISVRAEEDESPDSSVTNTVTSEVNARREEAKKKAEEAKKNREAKLAELKAQAETRKAEVKADVCEKRQDKLQALLPKLSKGATTVKGRIDNKYEKVQAFYESKNLNLSNYDELVGAIETAKANSEASIAAVNDYSIEVDCTSDTLGSELDGYRSAVGAVKEDLKAYRDALVNLITALRGASSAQSEQTEGEQ